MEKMRVQRPLCSNHLCAFLEFLRRDAEEAAVANYDGVAKEAAEDITNRQAARGAERGGRDCRDKAQVAGVNVIAHEREHYLVGQGNSGDSNGQQSPQPYISPWRPDQNFFEELPGGFYY